MADLRITRLSVMMVVAAWMLTAGIAVGDDHTPDRPNIVVFLIDDMGLMDSSVPFLANSAGQPERHPLNEYYRTPSMERLADQGVRFTQFYAMSVCSPTRVSIMTGQTSARHHTTNWILSESNNRNKFGPPGWRWEGITPDDVTLPELLKEAGYRTIHAGKAHFGPNDAYAELPEHFGFDVNIAGCSWGQPGSYYGRDNFGHGNDKRERRAVPGLEQYHGKDIYLTEALTREINKEITRSVNDGKPFFAYMSHYAVHAPFEADARFIDHYPQPPELSKNKGDAPQAFATMIEGIDKSLGDMLDHLEALGVAENTLVFFLGDNGSDAPLGPTHEIICAAPLRGKKGTHYEGGMRVPFIAAWAKPDPRNAFQKALPIPRGSIHSGNRFGAVYDLFPTILNVARVDWRASMNDRRIIDGIDLRPMLTGAGDGERRGFLMHFPHQHRSSYFTVYRRGNWKLIYHYRKPVEERYELFNLAKDRDESNNLASQRPKRLRTMMTAMAEALEQAGAQYPVDENEQPVRPIMPEE